jgi:hypothetical protein
MANPNIVNVSSILGVTTIGVLNTTNTTVLLANGTTSGSILKINSILIANVNGTSAQSVTMSYAPNFDGSGTAIEFANAISVPADSSLQLIDKDSFIYLLEGKSIIGGGNTAAMLEYTISYENIS